MVPRWQPRETLPQRKSEELSDDLAVTMIRRPIKSRIVHRGLAQRSGNSWIFVRFQVRVILPSHPNVICEDFRPLGQGIGPS